MAERTLTAQNRDAAAGLSAIARELGVSPAQLALAWILRKHPRPALPIIGARKISQLEDNLAAGDLQLDAETIQRLDALKPPPETYPASLLASQFFHTMMLGQHHAELLSR